MKLAAIAFTIGALGQTWPSMPGWTDVAEIWSTRECSGETDPTKCHEMYCDMCQLNSFTKVFALGANILPDAISNLISDEEKSTGHLCGVMSTPCQQFQKWYDDLPSALQMILGMVGTFRVDFTEGKPWPGLASWGEIGNVWDESSTCKGVTDLDICQANGCSMCKLNGFRKIFDVAPSVIPDSILSKISEEERATGNLCGVYSNACSAWDDWFAQQNSVVQAILGATGMKTEFFEAPTADSSSSSTSSSATDTTPEATDPTMDTSGASALCVSAAAVAVASVLAF